MRPCAQDQLSSESAPDGGSGDDRAREAPAGEARETEAAPASSTGSVEPERSREQPADSQQVRRNWLAVSRAGKPMTRGGERTFLAAPAFREAEAHMWSIARCRPSEPRLLIRAHCLFWTPARRLHRHDAMTRALRPQFGTASEAPSSTAAQAALSVSDSLSSSDVSSATPRSSTDVSDSDGGDEPAAADVAHGEHASYECGSCLRKRRERNERRSCHGSGQPQASL